jgi:chorismate mutase/prephenate dehydrogenase
MELLLTGRHFAQSAELYASIQMSNPAAAGVVDTFLRATAELRDITGRQDRAAFGAMFERVRRHFGPFTEQALAQSDFLIDRLVERA